VVPTAEPTPTVPAIPTVAAVSAVAPEPKKKGIFLTPDLKLIHAIFQSGLNGYFAARRFGIHAETLYDEARPIWLLMEEMMKLGRLPSLTEVHLKTGIEIHEICPDPIDVELASKFIVKRGLTSQLHEKLAPFIREDQINQDPFATRDRLVEIYQETAWGLGNPVSINSRSAVDQLMASYNKAASRGDSLLGLSSPWPTPDSASLGLQPGELTVVFAKRKIGKSWIVIVWTVHMWRKDLKPGEKILFVTMEMTELQIMRRMACVDLKLPWNDLREGKLDMHQKKSLDDWCNERIAQAQDPSKSNIIFATSKQCRTAKDIGALVAEIKPVCVVVDSFYILGRGDGKSIYEKVLGNVEALKLDVALQYDVPVLASTQLKGTIGKDTLSADSDDAMGAKAIGDYADMTRGLFADEELWTAQERLWRGMEAREFKPKDVHINFNFDRMDFSEIDEITGQDFKKGGGKDEEGESGFKKKPPKPSAKQIKSAAQDLTPDADDADEMSI
jgi:DnaB helicase-like protein